MLNAPISQIMNTSWDQWQTTRFSVFKRVSRVEVNPQKDLAEMLTKLDETSANTEESRPKPRKLLASRRKLMELTLPCGLLALLSLIYSLIYMVDYGNSIVAGVKTKRYTDNLETFDTCVIKILHEHSQRLTMATGFSDGLADVYYRTDAALDSILNSKTLHDWKLLSQINDWRMKDADDFIKESEFYLQFIMDLKQNVILSQEFELQEVHKWKPFYEYLNAVRDAVHVDILLNILNTHDKNDFKHGTKNDTEKIVSFVADLGAVLCKVNKEADDKFVSCSFTLFELLQPDIDFYISNHQIIESNIKTRLRTFRTLLEEKKISLRKQMKHVNTRALTSSAVLFCMLFVFIAATSAGISMFVYVFRDQTRVAAVVSDMLDGVITRVKQQRESTDQVVNKLIPKTLVRKVNGEHHMNMIPYQASDTTLLMVSIADYNRFFGMFTASQTIHILTLVIELLDERMEQYNVFPVSRMGEYLLVLSDSDVQKQVRNACEIANLAIDIMTCCSDLEIGRQSTSKLQMKLAIHTGPCHGRLVLHNGTVQLKIVGNTLTVLRQIHKAAVPNMIQVSETTQKLLVTCDCYSLHYRGNLKIPDMSKYYKVYWLNGRRVSSALSLEDTCSRMGSWIELERKPLYRLDENDGTYEPLNKSSCRRYSQTSASSYINNSCYTNNASVLGASDTSL